MLGQPGLSGTSCALGTVLLQPSQFYWDSPKMCSARTENIFLPMPQPVFRPRESIRGDKDLNRGNIDPNQPCAMSWWATAWVQPWAHGKHRRTSHWWLCHWGTCHWGLCCWEMCHWHSPSQPAYHMASKTIPQQCINTNKIALVGANLTLPAWQAPFCPVSV